jgi:hypothetical protein
MGPSISHEVHLSHELVGQTELEILIGKLLQGSEPGLARRRHQGIERAGGLEEPFDRFPG